MRIAAVILGVLLLGSCATPGDDATELCEIELSIVHYPHLIQSTQSTDADGISTFQCTLSTNNSSLAGMELRRILEPECREFMREATSSATACTGVLFEPSPAFVILEAVEGTDSNGPFFALRGRAKRHAP